MLGTTLLLQFSYVTDLCRIPDLGDHDSYVAAIEALPLVQTPEVFGLHANADISYYTSATKALWRNLVRLPHIPGFLVLPACSCDHDAVPAICCVWFSLLVEMV